MPLTQSQKSIWEKARALGSGGQAVRLDDSACTYLLARIAADLNLLAKFPDLPSEVPDFFSAEDLGTLRISAGDPKEIFERLLVLEADCDMFFACLAALHKARLKYEAILKSQPVPTLEQVGPRGLLQFGKVSPKALSGFLFWRKWFFDIDNRAGQETGYLFEPVIANAVGGTPVSASRSPVRRRQNGNKGRQVDCLLGNKAYELKIRMTIAASGQGRWGEELDFPLDCVESGYTPVLLVLDSTPNEKLAELSRAFLDQGGEVYVGAAAWKHLDELAGPTMAHFIDNYVRAPIASLISEASDVLPDFSVSVAPAGMKIEIFGEQLFIAREEKNCAEGGHDQLPESEEGDM